MKKIFLVLFSLIMMCSVSYGIEVNEIYSSSYASYYSTSSTTKHFGSYKRGQVYNLINNYYSDTTNETYKLEFDTFIEDIESNGYQYCIYYSEDKGKYFLVEVTTGIDLCVSYNGVGNIIYFYDNNVSSSSKILAYIHGRAYDSCYYLLSEANSILSYGNTDIVPYVTNICKTNMDIYSITSGSTGCYWDGESYFYKQGGNDSTIPDLTDEQIAEIVERFINSDAYLEKAYYDGDYFITYDNLTGYFRGYSYSWNIDLSIEYGNYNEEGEFVTTGTTEGEAWRIRPYEFSGDIFVKFGDWLASKFNTYAFEYFSISPDSSIEPRYIGSLEHNYCSNYKENEVVIYSSKQIRYVGEETDAEGNTETVITDNYIPPTVLKDSETGEEIIIRDNLQNSSDSLENVITPNANFSGLKEAFEKYISFVNISSITWLTTAISSMITIFIPFVALGIIIFLINRILNGGS